MMEEYGKIKQFKDFFFNTITIDNIENNGLVLTFKIKEDVDFNNVVNEFQQIFIHVQPLANRKIEIKKASKFPNCFIFFDLQDFFNGYETYRDSFLDSIILVIDGDKSYLKDRDQIFSIDIKILFNYFYYRKIVEYLKNNTLFTTLYTDTKFIIISKSNGVFDIGFKYHETRVTDLENLQKVYTDLQSVFEKKEFIQLFKETIINSGIHQHGIFDRLFEILRNFSILINLTEKDFENYVSEFSFEKIKSKFKEERNKYFESLEKNIEVVSKQVVSFPLTFAATVFASYQVKDKPLILFLIVGVYGLYTLIAFKVLNISRYNVDCLKIDVDKEKKEIENNYSKSFIDFKNDFEKIDKKVGRLESLISCLKKILILLFFLFLGYSIYQMYNNEQKPPSISIPIDNISSIALDTVITHFEERQHKADSLYRQLRDSISQVQQLNTKDSIKVKDKIPK